MSNFDPALIASLMEELYKTIVEIAPDHFRPAPVGLDIDISFAPHTPPVKVDGYASLEPQVFKLIELLPYFNCASSVEIEVDSQAIDYRFESGEAYDPMHLETGEEYVEPWIIPLTKCKRDGMCVMLDTRTSLYILPSKLLL